MSYRIVYDHVAVHFPAQTLRPHFDHYGFHADQFLLFELGGDNNLYLGRSGKTRVRSWSLIGAGQDWEVMRGIVGFAAACEGGGMRFATASRTQAESYIRRCRGILGSALTPDGFGLAGMSATITLRATPAALSAWKKERVKELSDRLAPDQDGEELVWTLSPLRDPLHAALFFAFRYLDDTPLYNIARVHGPEYDTTPVLKRVPCDAFVREDA